MTSVSSTAAAAAAPATASRNRHNGTAHEHHDPQDLADHDHRGDQPRGERLDPPDQIGDEPHDGLVEEGTDEHDRQQRPDGDGEA
jgi:hypothetical protein